MLKTDYLWKEILTPEGLTDILENYAQVIESKTGKKARKKRTQVFPFYHQLGGVHQVLVHVAANGAGSRYLIQHSAGSGKSNSIAWLAHQLIALKKDGEEIFDSVIVVTDSYTMKQAIQEGFTLDVLRSYSSVDSYYKLVKKIEGDPEFDTRRAQKKLRKYVESHNHAIRLKSEIMVDHFHKQDNTETITAAFSDYYRTTVLSDETNPNNLHDLKTALDEAQVYSPEQVQTLVDLFLSGVPRDQLDPILDACVSVYMESLDEDGQVEFKGKAKSFARTHDFLATILPYTKPKW